MAKLSISPNLDAEELDLLEAAGFESDQDLLSADPQVVHRELVQANEMLELASDSPSLKKIEEWITSTKDGGGPAARKAAKKSTRKSAAKETTKKTVKKSARKTTKKTARKSIKKTAKKTTRKSAKQAAKKTAKKAAAKTAPGVTDEPVVEEAAVQRLDVPVNFEADPDVQEMLARAPVALPIANRMLADAGIRPAEILTAPLLNRADSDLEVNVSVGEKKRELAGMPKRRASGVVQVADFRSAEKVSFDTSRVRHIDETHDDPAPPPRADVDERTRLIRTAKETTNRGKDPKSKRFVRGVLHDRGLKVLMGCVSVLLLQISIPLAIVAAPLLILSDVSKEGFDWVPKWLIAFPIAVPVFGILYFVISFRVRCRVCSQRLLAPRQCLKNRKAHHIPLLGHIFALALHAVIFRWFHCTYCGTAVRIKE